MMENMDQHLYMIMHKMGAEIYALKSMQSTIQPDGARTDHIHVLESTSWFNSPFYTQNGEYMMCLKVDIARYDEGASIDVSAYIHLMRGIFDGDLKFPFQSEVNVQLVNQMEGSKPSEYHHIV